MQLPVETSSFLKSDEQLYLTPEGLKTFGERFDPKDPAKHLTYTNDYTVELPIIMKKSGPGSEEPITISDFFEESVKKHSKQIAMRVKREGKWVQWTYQDFYNDTIKFAQGLLALNITRHKALNIIGMNAPEWFIAFYAGMYAAVLPVGVYTTNGPDACFYVADHSEAEVVLAEDEVHLKKYLSIWNKLPQLKYIILYGAAVPSNLPEEYKDRVLTFKQVTKLGEDFKPASPELSLEVRRAEQKPGKCCTLVYTSGTTGQPKGVMLSHDNYTWTARRCIADANLDPTIHQRLVSYLPLSHVAGQLVDLFLSVSTGGEVTFADASALQGSLINYLREVRPTIFFSVPRVWEKIEEQMKNIAAQSGPLKSAIANWAKKKGTQGTLAELQGEETPFGYGIAKKLIFDNIRKALGLDQARFLIYGAAPLSYSIREYFLSLNFYLINVFGMSEGAGPVTWQTWDKGYKANLKSAGPPIKGTEIHIHNPDKDGEGEICYRGRNVFMGYLKNAEETKQTLDAKKYVHSGDVGKLDKYGNLLITGRIKELLVTAGGENIAPVPIENEIKKDLPFVSNAVVIGDKKKFLSVLLTLKHVEEGGQPGDKIAPSVFDQLEAIGIEKFQNVEELYKNKKFIDHVQGAIDRINKKSVSRAAHIRKWTFLKGDFSINGGEITPTLKLKRNIIIKKYLPQIEAFYLDPKL